MQQGDRFCSVCATPLVEREHNGKLQPVCPACGRVVYYDPKVAAVSLVAREGKMLMVRRANEPGYGLWSIPGGYVDRGEVVEAAAAREVLEETGLEVAIEGLVGLFSQESSPVIVAAYGAVEIGGVLTAGPETLEVAFFALDALPPLAFPRDEQILRRWRESREKGR